MNPEYFSPHPTDRRRCREAILDSGIEEPVLLVARQPRMQEDPSGPHTPVFLRNSEPPKYRCYFGWIHAVEFVPPTEKGLITLANHPHEVLFTSDRFPTARAFKNIRDYFPQVNKIPISEILGVGDVLGSQESRILEFDHRVNYDPENSSTGIGGIDLNGLVEIAYIDRDAMTRKVLQDMKGVGRFYAFSSSKLQNGTIKGTVLNSAPLDHVRGHLSIRPGANDTTEDIYLSFLQHTLSDCPHLIYVARDLWKTFLEHCSSLSPIAARTLLSGAEMQLVLDNAKRKDYPKGRIN